MGTKTKISWTDSTWNPLRGCTIVSQGCKNCYAMRTAARFSKKGEPYHGLAKHVGSKPRWTGKVTLVENHLKDPMKWQGNRRIFVNSMSDLFHEKAKVEWIDRIFAVMAISFRHRFQVLTKRHKRMEKYTTTKATAHNVAQEMAALMGQVKPKFVPEHLVPKWPLPNVWVGVSTEDQATYNKRIDSLMQSGAAVKFLSCEPLLGPIDLLLEHMSGKPDWVIVGAESGPGARPMQEDWVREIRDQCVQHKIPFFYKQKIDGNKKIETPFLDGTRWVEYPDQPYEKKVKLKNIIV